MKRQLLLTSALAAIILPTHAAPPIDFGDRVQQALLCRGEWSNFYWQDYFNVHLNPPIREWGEARWWNAQNAPLGGVNASEVFMNIEIINLTREDRRDHEGRVLMVGALIPQPVEQVKATIENALKITFRPYWGPWGTRYINDSLSVLQPTVDNQTKWFCGKWNLGNRP